MIMIIIIISCCIFLHFLKVHDHLYPVHVAVPCLGLFTGYDYYMYTTVPQNLEGDEETRSYSWSDLLSYGSNGGSTVRVKRNTFCVRLLKKDKIVELTYQTTSAEDRYLGISSLLDSDVLCYSIMRSVYLYIPPSREELINRLL